MASLVRAGASKLEVQALSSKPPTDPDKPDLPAEFRRARVGGALDQLTLEGLSLERADFSGQIAADVRIEQCRLAHVDLTGTQISRAFIQDTLLVAGSWANVRIEAMRTRRVAFKDVRMTGANLASASLEDVSFSDCRIDLGSFRFAKLTRISFQRCRLDEIDFSGAELASVAFVDCVLIKAMWADATLTRCEMRRSDISGAGNPERLRGVRMPWADALASAGELAAAAGVEIVE
jgi:uncharacterized protein YjbI with pentapeptide repeats